MKELEKITILLKLRAGYMKNGKIKSISMQRWTEAKSLSQ